MSLKTPKLKNPIFSGVFLKAVIFGDEDWAVTAWILATGFWDDTWIWEDSANWID